MIATFAPARPRQRAVARPRPVDEPVTRAVRPRSEKGAGVVVVMASSKARVNGSTGPRRW